jgi:hypothetical protein
LRREENAIRLLSEDQDITQQALSKVDYAIRMS